MVCGTHDNSSTAINQLNFDLAELRRSLFEWCQKYNQYTKKGHSELPRTRDGKGKQFEVLGLCFTCLIIVDRLIFALDPLQQLASEEEAQKLAAQVVTMEQDAISVKDLADLFMALKVHVAKATMATANRWREGRDTLKAVLGSNACPISEEIFVNWCESIGWKVIN